MSEKGVILIKNFIAEMNVMMSHKYTLKFLAQSELIFPLMSQTAQSRAPLTTQVAVGRVWVRCGCAGGWLTWMEVKNRFLGRF